MKIISKKLQQPYFNDVSSGLKKFELRKDDCDYQVGDILILKEWNEAIGYTGDMIKMKISYKLEEYTGLQSGYCILGLEPISEDDQDEKIYTILMKEINKYTGEILVSVCERGVEEELKKRIGYLHVRSIYNQDLSFYLTLEENENAAIEILKNEIVENEALRKGISIFVEI